MKKILFLLFINLSYCQSSIIASGSKEYTIGETFPIMQQVEKIEETLGVPKFELPEPSVKPIAKKKTLLEKIIDLLKKIFK
jgi:hypothetical protein